MLKYVTIFSALLLAFLDCLAYRRIKKSGVNILVRYFILLFLIVLNILPIAAPLLSFAFMDESNSQGVMKGTTVIFTLYIVFTLTRFVFYIFWLSSRRRAVHYTGIALSSVVLLLLLKSVFITRTDYTIKEVDLKFPNLPASFNGYRIAFLSDIHVGAMYDKESELSRIVDKVTGTGADIVLYGGDLINIHHSELDGKTLQLLSRMRASHPTVAVLGNHDTGAYLRDSTGRKDKVDTVDFERKIASAGWVILKDSTLYLHKGKDSITVTGIDYSEYLLKHKHSFGVPDNFVPDGIYAGVDTGVFNITLSHLPQLWSKLVDGGYSDLTLSGHIHAFQFKIEMFGKSFSPASFLYEHWTGLYENEDGKLYITDGTGTVGILARIGAPPEITVINLYRE